MGSDLLTFPPSAESAELAAERAKVADLEIKLNAATMRAEQWRLEIGAAIARRVPLIDADGLHPDRGWQLVTSWLLDGGPFRLDIAKALGIDPWRHNESSAARTWESIVEFVRELRVEKSHSETQERDLVAVRETMSEIAKILRCGRSAPQVFDAITRLKEQNATLTSETASQLATERAAHRATIAGMEKYGKTPAEVLGAIAAMEQEVDRLRGNARASLAQFEGFIREAVATGTDGRFAPVAGHSATQMVRDLAEEWLVKSYRLDALRACEDDEDDENLDDGMEISGAPPPNSANSAAVVSLQTAVATNARDWSATPGDAWIYGVVLGWGDAELVDLAARFGWKQATIDHLTELNAALVGAETGAG